MDFEVISLGLKNNILAEFDKVKKQCYNNVKFI